MTRLGDSVTKSGKPTIPDSQGSPNTSCESLASHHASHFFAFCDLPAWELGSGWVGDVAGSASIGTQGASQALYSATLYSLSESGSPLYYWNLLPLAAEKFWQSSLLCTLPRRYEGGHQVRYRFSGIVRCRCAGHR